MTTPTAEEKRRRLRALLDGGGLIVAPGVYDGISARIADAQGFDALYMTGYGVTASYLGLPDAGLATYTDMVGCVRRITEGTATPLIADADTGYGGALNVEHTIRGYESAGACAIQLEDQEFPKRCGHTLGRRVIPRDDMVLKLRVAAAARRDPNMLIIARTDARTSLGLDEALDRARAYRDAGADILFVESPESEAEMEKICRSFDRPCLANMVEGGRTPVLTAERLRAIGYRIAIFPATAFLTVGLALENAYGVLKQHRSSAGSNLPLKDFMGFSRMVGFERVWDFDKKWGTAQPQ